MIAGITTNPAAGFPTLGTEWDEFGLNDVSGLGDHEYGEAVADPTNVMVEQGDVFKVLFVDDNDCSAMTTIDFTIDDLPIGSEDATLVLCEGDIVDLDTVVTVAGGAFSIGDSTISNIFNTDGLGGDVIMVSYTIASGNSCNDAVANICILVNPKPPVPNVEDITVCEGEDTSISPIPPDFMPIMPRPF